MHLKHRVIILLLLVNLLLLSLLLLSLLLLKASPGFSPTLYAQGLGWNGGWGKMEDPLEHAFTMDVPVGWKASGGAYRLGYGDVRVMVDLWSPDKKTNLRYGDLWFSQSYATPNQYHHEGEAQDLGAVGQGTYAAYRTGQEFAELYARESFRGVCKELTPHATNPPLIRDNGLHRQGDTQFSEGEVSFQCETPQGPRIAYAYARTTLTTSRPLANMPPTTAWTPVLVSYLAPLDQVSIAASIARRLAESFKVSPPWQQHQNEMDKEGTAYAIARAQRKITQQQEQFARFSQSMNQQVRQFQQGQSRQQGQVDGFLQTLNGFVPTNDPTHSTVPQGTHQGKWNCSGSIVDSDLSPGLGCQRIN